MKKNQENNVNKRQKGQEEECTSDSCTCKSDCGPAAPDYEEEITVSLCDDADSESAIQKRRADEMMYQAQRIQAEFDNYRRRTAEAAKQLREDGRAEVIEKMLPALDAFGQAAKVITDPSILQGVNLILDRIMSSLSQFGLSKIEAQGKAFDPSFHEAVLTRDDNSPEGTILEVLQDGYMLNGKVLRAAMVITSG